MQGKVPMTVLFHRRGALTMQMPCPDVTLWARQILASLRSSRLPLTPLVSARLSRISAQNLRRAEFTKSMRSDPNL
jgi:hypothetical protein